MRDLVSLEREWEAIAHGYRLAELGAVINTVVADCLVYRHVKDLPDANQSECIPQISRLDVDSKCE